MRQTSGSGGPHALKLDPIWREARVQGLRARYIGSMFPSEEPAPVTAKPFPEMLLPCEQSRPLFDTAKIDALLPVMQQLRGCRRSLDDLDHSLAAAYVDMAVQLLKRDTRPDADTMTD